MEEKTLFEKEFEKLIKVTSKKKGKIKIDEKQIEKIIKEL